MKKWALTFAGITLAIAYLLPNHYPPWASFHADMLTAVAFIPLLLWAIFQRGASIPALASGALLVAVVPLVQFSIGQIIFAGDAVMASLYISGFALTVFCGAQTNHAEKRLQPQISLAPIQLGILVAGLVSTGIALHQWLGLGIFGVFLIEIPLGARPFANLAQPNQLATLLMLSIVAVIFLFEANFLGRGTSLVACSLLAFGIAITQSRTALLGLIVIWIAYFFLRNRAKLKLNVAALALPTSIFLISVWSWPTINDLLLLPRDGSIAERMGENLRLTLWRSMMQALFHHPLIGYGWNQISLAQHETALSGPATHYWFDSSHNIILDLALWMGIPAALLVVSGTILWLLRCILNCKDALSFTLIIGIIIVLCHAMVEYPLAYAYFLLPVGLFMGSLSSSSRKFERVYLSIPRAMVAMVGVTAVAIAVFAKVVVEYIALEEQWRNVRMERTFAGGEVASSSSKITLLTQLEAREQFARIVPHHGMSSMQLNWMRLVSERYPTVNFMLPYAQAAILNENLEVAMTVLARICKVQSEQTCRRTLQEWSASGFQRNHKLNPGVAAEPVL